jgi:16S rRNA processing protein RimM
MSKESAGAENLIAIGAIRRPFGLKGHCYVEPLGETLCKLNTPFVLLGGPDPATVRELVLLQLRDGPRGPLCKFQGIDDVDAAGTLRGWYLFCKRTQLPPLAEGKHYHFELEGLSVVGGESGKLIGTIVSVREYPTVDALDVRKEDGSIIAIPMTPDAIKSVDKGTGVVTVSEAAIEEVD